MKRQTKHRKETDLARILDLSGREYKTNLINMLSAVIDKIECMQKLMGNTSREMEILRKNWKEMQEIKNECNRNEVYH